MDPGAVFTLFRDSDEKWLMQFRDSNAASHPLLWSFFGGVVQPGENSQEAALREAKEELELPHAPLAKEKLRLAWYKRNPETGQYLYVFLYTEPICRPIVKEGAGMGFFTRDELVVLYAKGVVSPAAGVVVEKIIDGSLLIAFPKQ